MYRLGVEQEDAQSEDKVLSSANTESSFLALQCLAVLQVLNTSCSPK